MTKFTTLAFMGESENGKDFCGEWVVKNIGYVAVAFADPMKRLCRTVFQEFTDTILWGDPKLRNTPISVDWDQARFRLVWTLDDWVDGFKELSIIRRSELRSVINAWFNRLQSQFEESKLSPRAALQLLGTEYGRKFKPDLWVAHTLDHVIPSLKNGKGYSKYVGVIPDGGGYPGAIITDCRFRNELEAIQDFGGYVVKLVRKSKVGQENTALSSGIPNHRSEVEISEIRDDKYDAILHLDEGADKVYPRLQKMFDVEEFKPDLIEP